MRFLQPWVGMCLACLAYGAVEGQQEGLASSPEESLVVPNDFDVPARQMPDVPVLQLSPATSKEVGATPLQDPVHLDETIGLGKAEEVEEPIASEFSGTGVCESSSADCAAPVLGAPEVVLPPPLPPQPPAAPPPNPPIYAPSPPLPVDTVAGDSFGFNDRDAWLSIGRRVESEAEKQLRLAMEDEVKMEARHHAEILEHQQQSIHHESWAYYEGDLMRMKHRKLLGLGLS